MRRARGFTRIERLVVIAVIGIMTANDKTFTWGRVGVGSFDDSGNWTDIKLRGVKVEKKGALQK